MFEINKINNSFIFTKIDLKLLELLELKQMDIIGDICSDFAFKDNFADKLLDIFDIAWQGKETLYFLSSKTNKNLVILINLRAIQENGKTVKLEGHCVPIEIKGFDEGLIGLILN
ncbi:hypothetical protein [Neobacillus niacini]|uniref:hypothetical protein n=1 Tax=Neobacillus niacini TaxID=86668 RepID=UPI002859FD16|nr:hypothetical protein [Neobacillus niacini]MDR6999821.1 hypothetical protein [Neobacillus niacini]